MKNKEECLKALCRIQCGAKANKDCKACECFDDKINSWKCVENTKESILIREVIEEHFELSNVIREESDDIQTVIDLLDSKVVTMGHISVAIKKLEIIQDKLMGVKDDA